MANPNIQWPTQAVSPEEFNTKVTALENADTANSAAINQEVTDRKAADNALQAQVTTNADNISALETNLATETATRTANDAALQTMIEKETTARTAADSTLQSNIDAEKAARESAIADINTEISGATGDISGVVDKVNTEISDRKAADTTLQNQIDTNAGDISALEADLASEVTARKNADSTLQTNINTVNSAVAAKLPLAGGTMTGAINMNSKKITGLANGTDSNDAVNYSQLSAVSTTASNAATAASNAQTTANTANTNATAAKTAADAKLPLAGGTMTGVINMNSHKITNVTSGTASGDAVNYGQLSSVSTTASNAATAANTANTNASSALTKANAALPLAGGTMTGVINMNSHKITNVTSGTASGDAVNYGQLSSVSTTASNAATAANTANTNASSALTKANAALPLAGGTMTGAINMNSKKITNLAAGTANSDAVNYSQLSVVNTVANNALNKANQAIVTGVIYPFDFFMSTKAYYDKPSDMSDSDYSTNVKLPYIQVSSLESPCLIYDNYVFPIKDVISANLHLTAAQIKAALNTDCYVVASLKNSNLVGFAQSEYGGTTTLSISLTTSLPTPNVSATTAGGIPIAKLVTQTVDYDISYYSTTSEATVLRTITLYVFGLQPISLGVMNRDQ